MAYTPPAIYRDFYPFFSVIVCTYNRADCLLHALDSILAQTESDLEIIVVDDGSTDGTFGLVRGYTERHANIRYLYHANRGTARSRNAGLAAACGLFVTFLDSDDRYEAGHLALRKEVLLEFPDVHLLHGGVRIIGDPYVPDKNEPHRMIHLSECVIGGTFVIRRSTALALGGFPAVEYADDSAFFALARSAGIPIARIDSPTYIYDRSRPDSLCNSLAARKQP